MIDQATTLRELAGATQSRSHKPTPKDGSGGSDVSKDRPPTRGVSAISPQAADARVRSQSARPETPIVKINTRPLRAVAITSGKGGVGKTNLSVNLAVQLAGMGRNVVLMDADLGTANVDVLCGLQAPYNLAHIVAGRRKLSEAIVTGPNGVKILPGASGLAQMAALSAAERSRVIESFRTLEDEADLMLIDTGAGIGPNVLGFLACCDEQLVVTTPEPTAITDAYAVIKTLSKRVGTDAMDVRVLINMVRSEAEAREVFGRIDGVARRFLGVPLRFAGYLLHDTRVTDAVIRRNPFVLEYPNCSASQCIARLAHRFDRHASAPKPGGLLTRLASVFGAK